VGRDGLTDGGVVLCVGAAVFVFAYLVRGLVSQLVAKSGCANASGEAGVSNCRRRKRVGFWGHEPGHTS
jgi:hypothetical protein